MIEGLRDRASMRPIAETLDHGEVVLFTDPYPAVDELIPSPQYRLSVKIVIDATNPVSLSPGGHIISSLRRGHIACSRMMSLLAQRVVVRAVSHIRIGCWSAAVTVDPVSGPWQLPGTIKLRRTPWAQERTIRRDFFCSVKKVRVATPTRSHNKEKSNRT